LVSANWDWVQSSEHHLFQTKGTKAPKGSDKQKGKQGDKSKKAKSGRKEKGERTGVKTKKGNTVCAPSGVVYTRNIIQSFAKELLSYTLVTEEISRNSCYVYSQDTEKSKSTSKQGSGSLVGTYF